MDIKEKMHSGELYDANYNKELIKERFIAKKICNYPEVQSCYLMSGSFDISVLLEGKTMKEVALFVAEKLAPIEQVQSTATHFVLKKYKDNGELYDIVPKDERRNLN